MNCTYVLTCTQIDICNGFILELKILKNILCTGKSFKVIILDKSNEMAVFFLESYRTLFYLDFPWSIYQKETVCTVLE